MKEHEEGESVREENNERKQREKGLYVGEDRRTLVSGFTNYVTTLISTHTAVSAVKSKRDSGVHACASV